MKRLLLCLLLAIVGGCATRIPLLQSAAPRVATVYVIDRGWHTDVGLAVSDVYPPLAVVAGEFPGARYLLFGFGDRAYLLSPHHTVVGDIAALFPGPSAILVTALREPPAVAFGTTQAAALPVTATGIERLNAFLWNQFSRNGRDTPIRLADGPYPGSLYYASPTTYDALFTCNSWAADALRSAGVPVSGSGVVLASQLMDQVHPIARTANSGPGDAPSAVGN